MPGTKKELIKEAITKYKRIFPCGEKRRLSECFTREGDELIFWFNTEDQSTRVMVTKSE